MSNPDNEPAYQSISSSLVYFTAYKVIVCKVCRFAVQPSAIGKHLLSHRIYREKRQEILQRIQELVLLQPRDVRHPRSIERSLPYLSVLDGFRCSVSSCGHLCSSQKRMSQHLREKHGPVNVYNHESSCTSVFLQTFFRGNKVHYFQVSDVGECANSLQAPTKDPSPGSEATDTPPVDHVVTAAAEQNIRDLLYMHRYVTFTGPTLNRGTEPATFWTHDVPLLVVEYPELVHGILGVAALHHAIDEPDEGLSRQHHEAGLVHQSSGLASFRKSLDQVETHPSTALMAFGRLLGVQQCAHNLLETRRFHTQNTAISQVVEFISLLRGGLKLFLDLQSRLSQTSALKLPAIIMQGLDGLEIPTQYLTSRWTESINKASRDLCLSIASETAPASRATLQSLGQVRQFMDLCNAASQPSTIDETWILREADGIPKLTNRPEHAVMVMRGLHRPIDSYFEHERPCQPLECYPHIPCEIYECLLGLPTLLASHLQRPSEDDLTAFNHGMAALISSFARFFATEHIWAKWNGIESWVNMLSDHFLVMIVNRNPWALVLVAHHCVLVEEQGRNYWHFQSQGSRILSILYANMDATACKVMSTSLKRLTSLSDFKHSARHLAFVS